MPIYEFECSACGDTFERLQRLADPDPAVCPQCGASRIKRRLTAPAFRLAGKGWYETDFKKDGDKQRNLAAKDDAPKADAKAGEGVAKKDGESTKPAAASSDKAASPDKKEARPSPSKAKPEGAAST